MDRSINFNSIPLKDKEFEKLSNFIFKNYGIKMPIVKKTMLQSRLQKRLRHLEIDSFEKYVKYVFSENGAEEIIHMMDVVSTNKTDFFREPMHFEFMTNEILPKIYERNQTSIKIWSAGSSSGEEAYTIAMVIEEYMSTHTHINYEIYGCDISTDMLRNAVAGVYKMEKVFNIPDSYKKKYLLKGKNSQKQFVRVKPHIRSKIKFFRQNFIESVYHAPKDFDIIFCRNTLIYFERNTQERVINRLCSHLKTGGCFVLGHSESITNMNVPLKQIKPTIFYKK